MIVDAVLYGMDATVLAFVHERLPHVGDFGPCVALGVVRDGALIGGVVFNNYNPRGRDIEISAAFDTSAWFRPRTLRRILEYPFATAECARLTLQVGRKGKPARAFAEKAGFRLEGVKRRGFDGRQDLMMYGLLASECRFLKGLAHG